ncbi:hypothetical protein OOU_Y34scaffold00194g29 [Pyricularia oryzae Y34]|uniref:Uncharacterized protein n=2 Tax=Pyricularia oryzae TaxID=318829 RepID=A0AA97P677_PYRO3|nr:hypothetical protein OOU_Y34scaffold00194g29 [Pyricularia oryzae Y34]
MYCTTSRNRRTNLKEEWVRSSGNIL